MKNFSLALALVLAAACGAKQTPAPPPAEPEPTTPEPVPHEHPHENPMVTAVRGATCDPQAGCGGGLTCMTYFGIAGASGPAFHSCETPCGDGQACPEGTACVTIADGPGQVCR